MKKKIHINQHVIKANAKHNINEPVMVEAGPTLNLFISIIESPSGILLSI